MGVKAGIGVGVGVCVGTGVNVAVGVCVGAGTIAGVGVSSGSPHSVIVAPISATVKKIAHTEMKLKPQPLSFVRNLSRRPNFIFAQLTRCNALGRKRNKPTAAHSKSAKSWPLNSPPSRDTIPIPPAKTNRLVRFYCQGANMKMLNLICLSTLVAGCSAISLLPSCPTDDACDILSCAKPSSLQYGQEED